MKPAENTQGVVNLSAEIETRRALSVEFDLLLRSIENGGISVSSPADLNALVLLLAEVIETRKSAEKQEKALKDEVKRHFPEGGQILDCTSAIVLLDVRPRVNLDSEAIRKDFGQSFFDKYGKVTNPVYMTVKVK